MCHNIEKEMLRLTTIISFFLLSISANAHGSYSQDENIKAQNSQNTSTTQATAADILSSLKQVDQATPVALAPMLTGSAELGLLYKTGNSNSGDFKSGLDLRFEHAQWLSSLDIDLLIKKLIASNYLPVVMNKLSLLST